MLEKERHGESSGENLAEIFQILAEILCFAYLHLINIHDETMIMNRLEESSKKDIANIGLSHHHENISI